MGSKSSGVSNQIISLSNGGGALKGIGEKFFPDIHTGIGNFSVPISLSPGHNGFQPQLNLVYSTIRLLKKYLFMLLFVIPVKAGIQIFLNLQVYGFPLKTCGNDICGLFCEFFNKLIGTTTAPLASDGGFVLILAEGKRGQAALFPQKPLHRRTK